MTATLSNSLTELADRVKAANDAVMISKRTTIEKAFEAGHLLIEAKDACKHGDWLPFLDRAGVKERTAQNFMTLARSGLQIRHVADLGGIRAALEHIAGQRKEAEQREAEAEELAEIIVLKAEVAAMEEDGRLLLEERDRLIARIKFFEEIERQGGPEGAIAVLDLRIHALERQKEDIAADCQSLRGSIKYWEGEARRLGYQEEPGANG